MQQPAILTFLGAARRCNYYLENMIDLVDEPMDSRLVWHINGDPISDGGQFDMAVNLLEVSIRSTPLQPRHKSLIQPLGTEIRLRPANIIPRVILLLFIRQDGPPSRHEAPRIQLRAPGSEVFPEHRQLILCPSR